MKKNLPLILFLVVAVAAVGYFIISKSNSASKDTHSASISMQPRKSSDDHAANDGAGNKDAHSSSNPGAVAVNGAALSQLIQEQLEEQELDDTEEKPAAEVYKSADEALKAIKQGASDYDDIILEQFTRPGENCTWCDELYRTLRESMLATETTDDERSYYGEILAISGRVDNVKTLVEAIKQAGDNEKGDVYAEALELTIGEEDVVRYLGEQLGTDNELLRESLIAAITNQGSRLAAELLYNQTSQHGDPDGYYSLGIGLGEFVPEAEALPYLQELMMKRDQYSHLATKSMLNAGVEGLKIVMDVLAGSRDPDQDRQLLKDGADHVSYDDEVESYLKKVLENPKNQVMADFAKQVLDEFSKTDQDQSGAG